MFIPSTYTAFRARQEYATGTNMILHTVIMMFIDFLKFDYWSVSQNEEIINQ